MSFQWDESLWDTFNPSVFNFSKYGLDFFKSFYEFTKQRSKIEENYCRELLKLCTDFRPKDYNKKSTVHFSAQTALNVSLDEFASLVEQRRLSGRQLGESARQMQLELAEMRKNVDATERRTTELSRELESDRKRLEDARGQYYRAHADLAKASAWAETGKPVVISLEQRRQLCTSRRDAYTEKLTSFNALQRTYYWSQLPEQLNRFEMQQRNFCTVIRIRMSEWCHFEASVMATGDRNADRILAAPKNIDPDSDVAKFVRITASGRPPPAELIFEEPPESTGINLPSWKQFFSNVSERLNPGTSESDEREESQKLKNKIAGLQKLRDAYQTNPSMGDPETIESELRVATRAYEELQQCMGAKPTGPEHSVALGEVENQHRQEGAEEKVAEVLYDFADPSQPSALVVTQGERVRLLQSDPEWAFVSRLDGSESGFVPTTYLSI